MKIKQIALSVTTLILCGVMYSCSASSNSAKAPSNISVSSQSVSSNINEESSLLDIPLSQDDLNVPLPNFLDSDQQNLYIRAYKFNAVFEVETSALDTMFPDHYQGDYSTSEILVNGVPYCEVIGRYRNWEDFVAVINSIYTKDYLTQYDLELQKIVPNATKFLEKDGRTLFYYSVRGLDRGYDRENMPETFRLINKSNEQIEFVIVVEKNNFAFNEITKETYISGTQLVEYPICMILTENGWRFSEFHIPY